MSKNEPALSSIADRAIAEGVIRLSLDPDTAEEVEGVLRKFSINTKETQALRKKMTTIADYLAAILKAFKERQPKQLELPCPDEERRK